MSENNELNVIVQEIKEGVIEAVAPAITKEVMEKVEAQMKEIKPVFSDRDSKAHELKVGSAANFKDMYAKLKSGEKTVTKQLNTEDETEGLEWTPEYFSSEVLRIAEKHGVARRDCRVVPMRGKTENWPTGGSVSVSRVDETDEIPVVQPETGNIKLTAKKLAAIIPMSREVVEYSNVAVVDYVARIAGEATARAEDYWLFRGLAAGEGVFQNADVQDLILAPGKTRFEDIDFADLLAAQSMINDDAFDEGVKYYLRRSVLNALRQKLIDESSNNLAQALAAIALPNLVTLPYQTVSVLPGTTDAGDQSGEKFMGLYNLSHVLMGDARRYELEMSREATLTIGDAPINLWQRDMVAIRVMESIDFSVSNADKAFVNFQTSSDLS
jgi:HK97 family phage major capsid protein